MIFAGNIYISVLCQVNVVDINSASLVQFKGLFIYFSLYRKLIVRMKAYRATFRLQ